MENSKTSISQDRLDSLYHKASSHIDKARQTIRHTIDIEMIKAYWRIGRDIIEKERRTY